MMPKFTPELLGQHLHKSKCSCSRRLTLRSHPRDLKKENLQVAAVQSLLTSKPTKLSVGGGS